MCVGREVGIRTTSRKPRKEIGLPLAQYSSVCGEKENTTGYLKQLLLT
jgi:hypothetical protein